MTTYNDLPVFLANVDDEACEITTISLVDFPAMEMPMQCFGREEVKRYTFADEKAHNILSVIVRTDFPILRLDASGNPFYLVFDKKSSETLARKLLLNGFQQNISLNHNGELIEGIHLQEIFLKDSSKGISPVGFEDCGEGSLFGIYHISDDNLWQQCLDGTFGGVSLESYIRLENFNKINKINILNKMQKRQLFRELLKDLFMSFNNLSTNKAELYWNEDTELMVGYEVFTEDESGNKVPAADGEYISDKNVIKVESGKVVEIKEKTEPEQEPVVEETPIETPEEKMEEVVEEVVEETPVEETPIETPEEKDDIKEKINELETRIADLEKKIADLESKIIEISTTPAAEPIVDEFEQVTKTVSTGDKKLDKRIAIARALRD